MTELVDKLDQAIECARRIERDLEEVERELGLNPDDWRLSLPETIVAEVPK